MTARIVVLDVETTGKEVTRDQVVEVSLLLGLGDDAECRGWRIKPSVAIHPEAQKVHGISAADLEGCPAFGYVAPELVALVGAADVIVGYNVAFDLDVIQAELERAGFGRLDLSTKQVVDVLRLWHHVEPRTLIAAHEKFVGAPLENAHAASVDVAATGRVLTAMLDRFGLAGRGWPELAAIANPFAGRLNWIGPTNHLQWDGQHAVFGFGKHKGVRVVLAGGSFLQWVLGKDFPPHVQEVCREAFRRQPDDLDAWIAERYPRPMQTASQDEAVAAGGAA